MLYQNVKFLFFCLFWEKRYLCGFNNKSKNEIEYGTFGRYTMFGYKLRYQKVETLEIVNYPFPFFFRFVTLSIAIG